MNDRDFMRYSRQILLDDIALDGQQKLLDSQVLIIVPGGRWRRDAGTGR